MRSIALSVGLSVLALGASAGAAAAHVGYVTTYRPVTVQRTVVVRERVWRPVRHRVVYRSPARRVVYRSYAPRVVYRSYAPVDYGYARPYQRYVAAYPYEAYPVYRAHHRDWAREREHERWEHERWERRHWGY